MVLLGPVERSSRCGDFKALKGGCCKGGVSMALTLATNAKCILV